MLAALVAQGADVVAVSRTRPGPAGRYRHAAFDLLDASRPLDGLFEGGIDTVLHLAWTVEHGAFWTSPENLDWIAASLRLARAANRHGVKRFVGVGTCYEYQWPSDGACCEKTTPLWPTTLYAVAKDATRRVLDEYARQNETAFAWARLFFLYGPDEGPSRLVGSVARRLARAETAELSRGLAVRDFMHVDDVGRALAALAAGGLTGAVNIASGEAVSVADIARKLAAAAGRPDLLRFGALPDRAGEPPRIVADVARLRNELGFRPRYGLDSGLAATLETLQSHGEPGR